MKVTAGQDLSHQRCRSTLQLYDNVADGERVEGAHGLSLTSSETLVADNRSALATQIFNFDLVSDV